MIFKRRYLLIFIGILLGILGSFSMLHMLPLSLFPVQQKPTPQPPKIYDYYIIIDEVDDHSLMYVPLMVNIGDEVITEENKRYKIVKIEQNRAIARFVEDVKLEEYKKKQ